MPIRIREWCSVLILGAKMMIIHGKVAIFKARLIELRSWWRLGDGNSDGGPDYSDLGA